MFIWDKLALNINTIKEMQDSPIVCANPTKSKKEELTPLNNLYETFIHPLRTSIAILTSKNYESFLYYASLGLPTLCDQIK